MYESMLCKIFEMYGYDWIYVHKFIHWRLYLSLIYFTFLESILLILLLLLLLLFLLRLLLVWLLLTLLIKNEILKWERKESFIIISDLLFFSKQRSTSRSIKTTMIGKIKSSTEQNFYYDIKTIIYTFCNFIIHN